MGLLDRSYLPIPGDTVHELPPLLVNHVTPGRAAAKMLADARDLVAHEDMVSPTEDNAPDRELGLALNIVEAYMGIHKQWLLGDSIISWITQCETTFGNRAALRPLLATDVWPKASRASFVILLEDKSVADTHELETSVGLRLAFRKLPPINCASEHFIFYLKDSLGETAYKTWADRGSYKALPPERFHFDVVDMAL